VDLDLRLGWDRFEKLILAVVRRALGLRGIKFRRYGVQGQAQHGIDLAGREPDGQYTVIQCKDYQSLTASQLRRAVETFATGRRPFEAHQLIVATSASTQTTQITEELAALQAEHPDFELDLWGAEQINDLLRHFGDVVAQFWTRETAATFCTSAPLPGIPTPPPDRQEQAERILVGPLATHDVIPKLRKAEAARANTPEESARLYGELAERLISAGYPGHATVLRDRQIDALHAAGLIDDAADLAAELVVAALHHGEHHEPRRLQRRLEQAAREAKGAATARSEDTVRHAQVLEAAVNYVADPIGRADDLTAALCQDRAEALPYYGRLVLLLAEGMLAADRESVRELDGLIQSAITRGGAANQDDVVVRLRLVVAEYDDTQRQILLTEGRRHRVPGHVAALISAREARRCALESRAEEALDGWRDAVHDSIHAGLTEDAADWLYAIRAVNIQFGPWTDQLDEEHRLALALRTTGSGSILNRARQPSERARSAVLGRRPIVAALSARRWLTDAVVTGSWADELEAAEFLGDLYRDTTELELAARYYARAGRCKKIIELADRANDQLLTTGPMDGAPWWVLEARITLAAAQADLLKDDAAADLLGDLIDLASRGRAGELIDSPSHALTLRATKAACVLAHRGTPTQARAVLDLLAVDVPREPNHHRYTDSEHAAACVEIALAHSSLAVPALTRLFDLAENDAHEALKLAVDERVLSLVRGRFEADGSALPQLSATERDELRTRALRLADRDLYLTDLLRYDLAPGDPAVQENALRARDRILSRREPEPGHTDFGSTIVTDAYLVRALDEDDRLECLDKLLCLAEDPREAAPNRQDALKAARNLVVSEESSMKSMIFRRSQRFVSGLLDGSAYDELTGPAHPLSAVQISIGTATLRGDGLRLAAAVAETDVERNWVREQALGLLQAQESSLVHYAALALSELPRTSIDQMDANLLAAHDHFGVRQLGAILSMRHPGRYRSTALRLGEDMDRRVRRTLAEAASRAGTDAPDEVRDVLTVLAHDVRYSVRVAATSRALA
jgi:Restriction endonuclease